MLRVFCKFCTTWHVQIMSVLFFLLKTLFLVWEGVCVCVILRSNGEEMEARDGAWWVFLSLSTHYCNPCLTIFTGPWNQSFQSRWTCAQFGLSHYKALFLVIQKPEKRIKLNKVSFLCPGPFRDQPHHQKITVLVTKMVMQQSQL